MASDRFPRSCPCPRPGRAAAVGGALVLVLAGLQPIASQVDYVVGPQDVLAITVYGQPTLTGKYTVEADGTFSFPLIGRIVAAGMTQRRIEESLRTQLLEGFLKNPQLTVAIEQYRSQQIFVIGEVREPGEYVLSGETTLMEAIARAGSPTPDASGEVVVLRPAAEVKAHGRSGNGQAAAVEALRTDLDKLRSGEVAGSFTLRDRDTILLPRGEKIYVYGQVRTPGAYAIQKDMTVLQALSLAGGATERAATNRVRIARTINGERKEIGVKLSDRVQPGDTIIVPERYF